MQPVSAVGIFCEDIREEKSGQDTIVGIFPDNISVKSMPGVIPKLAIYLRLNLDVANKPKNIEGKLINSNGSVIPFPAWSPALIDKAFSDSQANQNPLAGFLLKTVLAPFAIQSAGKLVLIATVDGTDYVAGALNVKLESANPPKPALESPPVA